MARSKRTRSGQYRDRVIIYRQNPSASANTDGERPEDPQEVCKRWAKIRPMRGRERWLIEQTQADVTHMIRLRYDSTTKDIDHTYWLEIVETSERLNIMRIYDPDMRKRELELECKQRV